jgi:clan AA aspartic protease
MGLTILELEVGNPASPDITEKVEFLIDSGAIYSVVPTPILEKLGIRPIAQQEFRLADGSKIVRKKGVALFQRAERAGGAEVIFGEEGDSTLLGAFTLTALGLALDPLRRELKTLPMILALQLGRSDNAPSLTITAND